MVSNDLIYWGDSYIKVIWLLRWPCLSWPWRRPISLTLRMTCMLTLQVTYILDLADDLYPWPCRWPQSLTVKLTLIFNMTTILDLEDDLEDDLHAYPTGDLYPWPCRWPISLTYILDLADDLYPWPCRWPQSLTVKLTLTFNMATILDLDLLT